MFPNNLLPDRSAQRTIRRVLAAGILARPVADPQAPLPEPVARFLRFAGVNAASTLTPVRIEQEGTFRLNQKPGSWRRFRAVQYVNPAAPAFVWNARMAFAPGISVRVEDSYLDGVGRLEARLGLFRIARQENATTLAAGELHRYLAEAVWNPVALQPGHGVDWQPIDRNSARASLTAHGITVSLDCLFDGDGRLISAFTPARYRDVKGTAVLTPWLCEYRDYVRLNQVLVPHQGSVSWMLPGGRLSYCDLRVTSVQQLREVDSAVGRVRD